MDNNFIEPNIYYLLIDVLLIFIIILLSFLYSFYKIIFFICSFLLNKINSAQINLFSIKMKINFDTLNQKIKSSLYTTQTSIPSSFYHSAHSKLSQKTQQKPHHQSYTSNHQNMHKSQISTQSAHTYSSIFHSHSKNKQFMNNQQKRTPKKFANLKTMQQMKTFIEAMNQEEGINRPQKYFQKQNLKNQSQFLKFTQLKSKKQKSFVQTLTDRLYYQSQRRTTNITDACCKRKDCKKNISTIKKQEIQNQKQFTGQPRRQHPALYKSALNNKQSFDYSQQKSVDSSFSTRSKQKDNVHIRLYEDYKERQAKNQDLRKQIQFKTINLANSLQQSRISTKTALQYTKNYQSFYERLQNLVQRQQNKQKIYDQLNLQSLLFKSRISKNKSSKQIIESSQQLNKKMVILSTKNLKCSKQKCIEKQKQIFNQLNRSRQKLELNKKSVSIIESHQKSIIQQIKRLFLDKKTGKIKVNSKKVQKLSNFQFDIFFKLIIQIEANSYRLKSQKMLEKLIIHFYQDLDTALKQQLRRLHILNSCLKKRKSKDFEGEQKLNEVKNKRILIQQTKGLKRKDISGVGFKYGVESRDYWTNMIDFV